MLAISCCFAVSVQLEGIWSGKARALPLTKQFGDFTTDASSLPNCEAPLEPPELYTACMQGLRYTASKNNRMNNDII